MTPFLPPDAIARLKSSLSGFIHQSVRPVTETDKIVWNRKLRRNELYYRGLQYLGFGSNNESGIVDWVPINSSSMGVRANLNNQQWQEMYDYSLNFLQGDVDTFISVIGSRSPNCQAQARDLGNDQQIRLKGTADRVSAYLDSQWNVEQLHPLLVRILALYGTAFGYTRYTVNASRYGQSEVVNYDPQEVPNGPAYYQCPYCGSQTPAEQAQALVSQAPNQPGVPCSQCGKPLGPESMVQPDTMISLVPTSRSILDNGAVELSILNSSHVTTTLNGRDLDAVTWLITESEEDKGALVRAYPELRPKAYDTNYAVSKESELAMGRYTREMLTAPTAGVLSRNRDKWHHMNLWLTPAAFEYLPDDRNGQLREYLSKKYTDGMKVPYVNGEPLIEIKDRSQNEALTSVWTVCKPKPSEMIFCDAYFECMIDAQDTINDCCAMTIEQAERSNPFVIADPKILSPASIMEHRNVPGSIKFAIAGAGTNLANAFFRVPGAEMQPELVAFIDKYVEWIRQVTGVVPAIFGGQAGAEMTAREAEMNRNQAMQKLGVPWGQLRNFWSKTRENGIYQVAKYSGGQLLSRPSGVVESAHIEGVEELLQGGWYMRCEESTPTTVGQRRDFVMHLLSMPPEMQAGIGMTDPDNLIVIQEAIGVSDFKAKGYNEVIQLHEIIHQLSQAQPQPPQPGPPDPMTGQPGPPGPPQSSIPFDQFLFDPPLALQVVKNWLLSPKGADLQRRNPDGYQNVLAFGHSIAQLIPPDKPKAEAPKMTISAKFEDMVPGMQEAVAKEYGIMIPPNPGPLASTKDQREMEAFGAPVPGRGAGAPQLPPGGPSAGGPPQPPGEHPGPGPMPPGGQPPPLALPPPGGLNPQPAPLAGPPN